jgi:hypothetical protein
MQDKQAEALRERLVVRLTAGGPREWRIIAWAIGQLGFSERGLRRIMELAPSYRHALGEQQVHLKLSETDKLRQGKGTALHDLCGSTHHHQHCPRTAESLCTAMNQPLRL